MYLKIFSLKINSRIQKRVPSRSEDYRCFAQCFMELPAGICFDYTLYNLVFFSIALRTNEWEIFHFDNFSVSIMCFVELIAKNPNLQFQRERVNILISQSVISFEELKAYMYWICNATFAFSKVCKNCRIKLFSEK